MVRAPLIPAPTPAAPSRRPPRWPSTSSSATPSRQRPRSTSMPATKTAGTDSSRVCEEVSVDPQGEDRSPGSAHRRRPLRGARLRVPLRVAVDSRPLEGAGRVEDTFNLLAHAARKVLAFAARLVDLTPEQIAERANTPLLVGTSVKAALDIEWSDPAQKAAAIGTLVEQLDRLQRWIGGALGENAT